MFEYFNSFDGFWSRSKKTWEEAQITQETIDVLEEFSKPQVVKGRSKITDQLTIEVLENLVKLAKDGRISDFTAAVHTYDLLTLSGKNRRAFTFNLLEPAETPETYQELENDIIYSQGPNVFNHSFVTAEIYQELEDKIFSLLNVGPPDHRCL